MSVESDLKKEGIEIIKKLDTLKVNSIARNISHKICENFPDYGLDQNDLFIRLSRLNMYIANMPEGMAEANYFYKNSSIYFNEHINYENIEEFAIHECIHYLQEVKDKKNYLIRMGLCDYTEFKIYGLGLNEAAVQLIASKLIGTPKDFVKYFNISFETNSPSCYPLECCLVNQLAYITGEDILFESTLNSNDKFKEKMVELTSYKAFMNIQNALDDILNAEEEIIKINNKIVKIDDRNKKVDNLINKINILKRNISTTFIKTQNLIISSYFDKQFDKISTLDDIESYRKRLYNFKDYLGSTEGYTYFNTYYVDKMMALEKRYNLIENGVLETSLSVISEKSSKILAIFRFIRNLFLRNTSKEYNNSQEK